MKTLLALALMMLVSVPAFAAPQAYTIDVGNNWASSSPSQQQSGSQQAWKSQQGQRMMMQNQQNAEGMPTQANKAKATKTSGKAMKKNSAAKKRMKSNTEMAPAGQTGEGAQQ